MSRNIETVQSIYGAFGRGDVDAILENLREDVVWEHDGADHGVPWLVHRRGRAEVAKFFEALAAVELQRFEPQTFLEGGDQVAVTIQIELQVTATQKKVRELEAHLWTFDAAGRVRRFKHLVDTHAHWLAWRG